MIYKKKKEELIVNHQEQQDIFEIKGSGLNI